MFRLKLFGSASIEGPEGPVTGRPVQRRRLALLALLALARQRGVTRDKLMGYLWPDADPDRARHLLSDSIYRINQAVGGEGVIAAGDVLRLNPDRLPADAWEFVDAMDRQDWRRAAELHAGPFLDGFYLTDADELERWVEGQRERFARDRARALEALAEASARDGSPADAVHWWRVLTDHEPYSSRIALRLMGTLEASGDRAAAVQHALVHTQRLEQDLGLAPDAELIAFADRLRTTPPPVSGLQPAARPAVSQSAPRAVSEPVPPAGRSPAAESAPPPAQRSAAVPKAPSSRARHLMAAVIVIMVLSVTVAVLTTRWQRGTLATGTQAIAVLPFTDLSADGDHAWFADGMTEELMARLAHIDGLRVVGRTSAFALRDRPMDAKEIGSRLNVTAVIQGSVRRSGDRLRIIVQLVDAGSGFQLWTDSYDREIVDVLAIQDDIAREVVTRLRGPVTRDDAERLSERRRAADDPEAFNLYLKARYQWHRRTEASLLAAAEFFRQAVAREPDYALAHAGLGDAYAVLGFYDFLPPREAFPAAAAAARRAIELQPTLVEPHATLGYVALYHDWNWEHAEQQFRRAIDLDPGYSTAHQWYANYLTAMGRFDEAAAEMGAAMAVDPLSVIANAALGWVLYYAGDYDRAIAQCTRALDLDANFALAYLWRAMSHEESGDMAAALLDFEHAVRLSGGSANHVALQARALARAGQREASLARLERLEQREGVSYTPPYEMAKVHEALGNRDAALTSLEEAYGHRSHSMAFLAVDPQLAALRSEPRFRTLIARVGLENTPGGGRLR